MSDEQLELLWMRGQRRVVREAKERMAALYVGVRDGYVAGEIATGRVKPRGNVVPSYLQEEKKARGLTGGDLEKAVDAFAQRMGKAN